LKSRYVQGIQRKRPAPKPALPPTTYKSAACADSSRLSESEGNLNRHKIGFGRIDAEITGIFKGLIRDIISFNHNPPILNCLTELLMVTTGFIPSQKQE
jgi:hypothetical protein